MQLALALLLASGRADSPARAFAELLHATGSRRIRHYTVPGGARYLGTSFGRAIVLRGHAIYTLSPSGKMLKRAESKFNNWSFARLSPDGKTLLAGDNESVLLVQRGRDTKIVHGIASAFFGPGGKAFYVAAFDFPTQPPARILGITFHKTIAGRGSDGVVEARIGDPSESGETPISLSTGSSKRTTHVPNLILTLEWPDVAVTRLGRHGMLTFCVSRAKIGDDILFFDLGDKRVHGSTQIQCGYFSPAAPGWILATAAIPTESDYLYNLHNSRKIAWKSKWMPLWIPGSKTVWFFRWPRSWM